MVRISKAAIKANCRLYWFVKKDESYWPSLMWKKEVIEAMYPTSSIVSIHLTEKQLKEFLPIAEDL